MLVAFLMPMRGDTAEFPGFHIATVVDGGGFHIKDHESFHYWWAPGTWAYAWTEERADPDD